MRRHAASTTGVTLIELMVGLAVGLFVAVVAISLFASTRTLAGVGTAGTRMSENGRLAMDLLHHDLRGAGFQGCKSQQALAPISTLNAGNQFLGGTSGIAGFHGDGGGFSPNLSSAFTAPAIAALAKPLADSDVLSMRVPIESLSLGLKTSMTVATGTPQVGTNVIPAGTIRQGSIVLIGNCKAAAIFQVTEADPAATGALSHAVAGPDAPGNAALNLQHVFHGDTTIWQLQTHHYFVADSVARKGTRSLWRYAFPPSPGKAEPDLEEVAAGIERMNITFGIAKPGERNLSRYVHAGNVSNWDEVVTVRVQLLAATTKDGVSRSLQTVSFAGSDVQSTDHRLRSALTDVVTLRNHAQ